MSKSTDGTVAATGYLTDAIRLLIATSVELCASESPRWICAQVEGLIDDARRVKAALEVGRCASV